MKSQQLSPDQLKQALESSDPQTVALACDYLEAEARQSGDKQRIADAKPLRLVSTHPFYTWKPRPDQPHRFDNQTAFDQDRSHGVSVCLGGTGSGKSDAAAHRVARFLLDEQPPPRKNTPWWVIGNTFELACGVMWLEKLAKFIPPEAIKSISWLDASREWPKAVHLKPWANGNSDSLVFKSTAQGRQKLEAKPGQNHLFGGVSGLSPNGRGADAEVEWEIPRHAVKGCFLLSNGFEIRPVPMV